MKLEDAIIKVQQKGLTHEWMWRLVVDHGYNFNEIKSDIDEAFDYWHHNVRDKTKKYRR